jgi:putative hydrolase of HD superfamily
MHSVFALMQFALTVKEIPRTGWNKKFPKGHQFISRKVSYPESVGAHIFGLAFLAMLVAESFPVNRLKLIMMAIVHDLVEAIAKDHTTLSETGRKRARLEKKRITDEHAAIEVIAKAGGKMGKKIKTLWLEFEAQKTPEAKLLLQLDKLEPCFQAERYHAKKQELNPLEFCHASKEFITEPKLLVLLSLIEKQCT